MFSYTNLIPKVAFVRTAKVSAVTELSFSELVAMYLSDCSNDVIVIHVLGEGPEVAAGARYCNI